MERARERRPARQRDELHAARPHDAPFMFVGEALALDLVNTEVVVRGKRRDLLDTPAAVAAWWQAARRHYPHELPAYAEVETDEVAFQRAITRLRAALRGLFGALADGVAPPPEHLTTLNAVLGAAHPALVSQPDGALALRYDSAAGDVAPLLPIALSAVRLATQGSRARLHRCANERCVLLFYDATKSATRRWCSLGCKDRDRKMKRYHGEATRGA